MQHTQQRNSFFNGEFSIHGSAWFFPYCFVVKTPLAVFGILAVAAVALCVFRLHRFYDLWPLAVLWGTYWIAAIAANVNIGQHHILPTYPPMFVFAGAAAMWFMGGQRESTRSLSAASRMVSWLMICLVAGFSIWFACASISIRPNYLAYFNELAGGPRQGYQHLVDSCLDWGQDLPGVRSWMQAQDGANGDEPIYLSYFGTARPEYYGIRTETLPGFFDRLPPREPEPLRPGTYLISATILQCVYSKAPGPWSYRYELAYRDLSAVCP